ncbi:MAG TPA: F0F1 ATP synthase subunit A [Isosphaeraceae bacterium]|jgi:F-type H+-transporting ATPase subunit a|nr:F0F1 ATP synthase subunit A [Isosphaeraceae bacterium]
MAAGHSPLGHVVDHPTIDVPYFGEVIHLPKIPLGFATVQVTRFMVMELIAAVVVAAIVIPLARHAAKNRVTRGPLHNAFEALILFVRDEIARPAIGGHGADQYTPFLLTAFFFILFNNLLGLIPMGASATGDINVTGVLAVMVLVTVIAAGIRQSGPLKFWTSVVPQLDVPILIKPPLWLLMFVIEWAGLLIRHAVLAIRLFANMLAGHLVLAVILGFAVEVTTLLWYVVAPASVFGGVAMSMLELLVAFLQAYVFTFLAALFIGTAVHPH